MPQKKNPIGPSKWIFSKLWNPIGCARLSLLEKNIGDSIRAGAERIRLQMYPSLSQRPEPHAHGTHTSRCAVPRTFKIKSKKPFPNIYETQFTKPTISAYGFGPPGRKEVHWYTLMCPPPVFGSISAKRKFCEKTLEPSSFWFFHIINKILSHDKQKKERPPRSE